MHQWSSFVTFEFYVLNLILADLPTLCKIMNKTQNPLLNSHSVQCWPISVAKEFNLHVHILNLNYHHLKFQTSNF